MLSVSGAFYLPAFWGTLSTTANLEPISISDDHVRDARKGKRHGLEAVLRANYPRICRVSYALCAEQDKGQAAAKTVLRRALPIAWTWEGPVDVAHWLLHHCVQTARQIRGQKEGVDAPAPKPREDCLAFGGGLPAEYAAFVKAIRSLPFQQMEAFLLTYGEELDTRGVAIAMDCSTAAAANHLNSARKALATVAGEKYTELTEDVGKVYAALTPKDEMVVEKVATGVSRHLARQRAGKTVKVLGPLLLLSAIALLVWVLWSKIII